MAKMTIQSWIRLISLYLRQSDYEKIFQKMSEMQRENANYPLVYFILYVSESALQSL